MYRNEEQYEYNICEKINYITGKIVAYLLLIVYPFVMHNIFNQDNKYLLFSNKKIMYNIKNIYALCEVSIIIIVCLVSAISTAAGKGIFIISDDFIYAGWYRSGSYGLFYTGNGRAA